MRYHGHGIGRQMAKLIIRHLNFLLRLKMAAGHDPSQVSNAIQPQLDDKSQLSRLRCLVDLPHLLVSDPNPIEEYLLSNDSRKVSAIKSITLECVKILYEELKKCVKVTAKDGQSTNLILPSSNIKLPRQKGVLAAPKLTKWQEFALKKGIKPKSKKPSIVFDEKKQDWVRRYGFKGANSIRDKEIIEIDDDFVGRDIDPWRDEKKIKRENVAKNEINKIRNAIRREKVIQSGPEMKRATQLSNLGVKKNKLKSKMELLRQSTASLGKHQKRMDGEKPDKRAKSGHKFAPNIDDFNKEKEAMQSTIRYVKRSQSSISVNHTATMIMDHKNSAKNASKRKSKIYKQN